MRGANGESRAVNNTLETINAAASAIASAENRVPQATVHVTISSLAESKIFIVIYIYRKKSVFDIVLLICLLLND